jgi:predicted nucleotidyltransferase
MPTALELTREERKQYKQASAVPPPRKYTREEEQEYERLFARVREAASEIKKLPGVTKVYVFGSFVDREWFIPGSDIDIAVEGIGPNYWEG